VAIGFFKLAFFSLPEDGSLVPKRYGDARVIFVLNKATHLVGVMNGIF
jgi:hypothetical protein